MLRTLRWTAVLCVVCVGTTPAWAQDKNALGRRTAFGVGLGATYGWVGVNLEQYVVRDRVSVLVGGGYWPAGAGMSTVAGAAAARFYSHSGRHRAMFEVSYTLQSVGTTLGFGSGLSREYGPGMAAGYHFTAMSGFSFLAALGFGWSKPGQDVVPILALGVGHAWSY